MKHLKILLLIMLMLALPARAATPAPEATPTPTVEATPTATVAPSKLSDDGLIRVWLKSLDAPEALHIALNGSYSLEDCGGFRFARDAELTFTASKGEIWLSVGGLSVDLGPALTLVRRAAESPNGLYIEEAAQRNLYCGDLSLTVTGDGLRPVLTLPVEDYLAGVVAYEMSDSFPLEALKAQAVAARTYALGRKWVSGRRDYDLVDTTADQVFRGYDPEYQNVLEAVRATRGLVGTYRGGFANCYYTASNGGQTALASQLWGGADADGYLAMVDDPYDLENPASLENDLSFTATCEGSVKLKKLLNAALDKVMKAEGYEDWMLDSIAAIEPENPRFEGSRLYDDLAFDLRVKVPESALPDASPSPAATPGDLPPEPEKWAMLEGTRRVTLSVFDDVKEGLSMGLNGADCELISVETQTGADGAAESFRLVMRRFGHGVGMSQRGAQWMAGEYGKDFMEILNFYYPGMTVERMEWPEDELTPAEALSAEARPMPSPTPSPAPLPRLKAGERYATVKASSLNVRQEPTTLSRVVDSLDKGRRLIVCGAADADGWVPVKTGDSEGYVKEEYLE